MPLNQIKPNLAGMIPVWVPFKIVSDSSALHSRWLLLLKIEISSIVHCCFFHPLFFLICIIGQNWQKFKVHKKSCNICQKAHHYAYTVQIWALSGLK
jgi:hypothetical protein